METLLIDTLNMSISASVIALVVILLRFALKKSPRIFSYALWIFVMVRLLLPFSFESTFSIFGNFNLTTNRIGAPQFINYPASIEYPMKQPIEVSVETITPIIDSTDNSITNEPQPNDETINESHFNDKTSIITILPFVWIGGALVFYIVLVLQDIKLRKKLQFAICIGNNVYECEEIDIPFLFGIIKPKIYVPINLNESQLINIITHESVHMKRLDYLVKFIATIILGMHWFNPVMWLSYYFMCEDMEMSCDEAALRQLGLKEKRSYGKTLIDLSSKPFSTTLAFSENKTESRIKNLLNYKKPKVWFTIFAFLILFIFVLPLLSNPISYGQDYNRIKEAIEYQTKNEEIAYLFATNNGNIDERFTLAFTEQPNYQILITLSSINNNAKSYFLYDTVVNQVISTYFDVDSMMLSKSTVDVICKSANASYVDSVVFNKMYEEAMIYSNSNLNTIENITSIPEFSGSNLYYINVDRERILIQYNKSDGAVSYILYNEITKQVEKTSSNMDVGKERLLEICEMITEYNRQDVAHTGRCALLQNKELSCPNSMNFNVPENIKYIFPLIQGEMIPQDNGLYRITTSLEGKQPVMATNRGVIIEDGEDEYGYYYIIDHLGEEIYYGGLSDDLWLATNDQIHAAGQLIGFVDDGNLVYGGSTITNETQMYYLQEEKRINVLESSTSTYFISDEQFEEIQLLFIENNPYSEYSKRIPVVESSWARKGQRDDFSVTAQSNDSPTLILSQSPTEDYFYIDKAYLINNTRNNVSGNNSVEYTLIVNEGQLYSSPNNISLSFRVNDNQFFNGVYDIKTKTLTQTDVSTGFDSLNENLVNAIIDIIDGECQMVIRTDKKVNELVKKAIEIITKDENYSNYKLETLE
ncbi:M56 family metallopeptidase [Anaerorhabdus sp.]|uniref:M56 family metallopeptidase n=1 Tax=Anaerorhabdus sp. TaxID=1872524 RepID=UPI002FC97166